MARTIDELIRIEARLRRAFLGYLPAVAAALAWPLVVAGRVADPSAAVVAAALVVLAVQVGLCVRFAVTANASARALGTTAWHYVAWILSAPFVAMLPIPIAATAAIALSPLVVRFLLGGQLQTAIREQTSMLLHVRA